MILASSLLAEKRQLSDELRGKAIAIAATIEQLNEQLRGYNESLGQARGWLDAAIRDQQSWFKLQSAKWQMSSQGEAYQDWVEAYKALSFEHAPTVDDFTGTDGDDIDALSEIPPGVWVGGR